MSDAWKPYVDAYIVNYVEASGKTYFTSCEHGAIVSNTDGLVWGSTPGFSFRKGNVDISRDDGTTAAVHVDEFANLLNAFANNGNCTAVGGLRINGEKFFMTSFDGEKNLMYLKKNGGGACIAKTLQSFCIGVYNTSKKSIIQHVDQSVTEQVQSVGVVNASIEKLQEVLLEVSY